jgi:hypothetical protein
MRAVWPSGPVPALGVARTLPWAELGLGLWLVSGLRPRAASVAVTLLLIAFSAFLFVLGSRIGWSKQCGCIGLFDPTTIGAAVIRNAVLVVLTVAVFVLSKRRAAG